jgi:hypothetical protein
MWAGFGLVSRNRFDLSCGPPRRPVGIAPTKRIEATSATVMTSNFRVVGYIR